MARYDVFPNLGGAGYLLDVQADIPEDLNTRVVVPLVPYTDQVKAVRKLNLAFTIDGKQYFMFTHLIATIPPSRRNRRCPGHAVPGL